MRNWIEPRALLPIAIGLLSGPAVMAEGVTGVTVASLSEGQIAEWEASVRGTPSAAAPESPTSDPLFDDYYLDDFDEEEEEAGNGDPLEPANRAIHGFNQGLDFVLMDPLTRGYQFIVPEPGRLAVRRFFENLNSPSIFVNDLLQGRPKDAGVTLARFLLNSTAGVGGIFDAAIEAGLERHETDFGQTLANYGVQSGPYIVMPLLGPSTLRDGFGILVDLMMQPITYIVGPARLLTVTLPMGTSAGFARREEHAEELRALRESSIDYYAALRSAYLQNRRAEVAEALRR